MELSPKGHLLLKKYAAANSDYSMGGLPRYFAMRFVLTYNAELLPIIV